MALKGINTDTDKFAATSSAGCSISRLLNLLRLAHADDSEFLRESFMIVWDAAHLLIGLLAVTIVDVLIWHAADVTTQLFCIGVTVCRPLYKSWLYRVADHIESVSKTAGDTNQDSTYGARKAPDLIALRTIGGSAVKPASDGAAPDKQRGSVTHSSRNPSSTLRRSLVFQSDARTEEFVMPIARMADLEKAVSSGGRQHR